MLALDIGFDQSPLICRDLHPGNSIKPLHPCTDVSATLEPFVKDICKSKIGKWFSLLRFRLRLNVNAKKQHRFYLESSGNAAIAVGPVDKQTGENGAQVYLLRVTTPSSLMMLGWSNCPMMDASARKSLLCLSVYPPFRVLMATQISFLLGSFRRPLHTSPNSPGDEAKMKSSLSRKDSTGSFMKSQSIQHLCWHACKPNVI